MLNNILSGACEQTRELITKSLLLKDDLKIALRGLIKILETFRQRNRMKAREAMRQHLQSFQRGYNVLFEASKAMSKETAPQVGKKLRTPKTPRKGQGVTAPSARPSHSSTKAPGASKRGQVADSRLTSLRYSLGDTSAAMST